METILLIVLLLAIAISAVAIYEDKLSKGYKPDARDGDGDGIIQEGTRWERSIKSAEVSPKKKKKAAAKKAVPVRKKK